MVQDLGGVILENLVCSLCVLSMQPDFPICKKCIEENKIVLLPFRSKFFFF